jgi:5-methylthioadenosine/S-adenosylhomocysteine deaminase
MTGEIGAKRYLIRGGRIYDHDGDIHRPETADLLIIERIAPHVEPDGAVEVLDAAGSLSSQGSSMRTTIRTT